MSTIFVNILGAKNRWDDSDYWPQTPDHVKEKQKQINVSIFVDWILMWSYEKQSL